MLRYTLTIKRNTDGKTVLEVEFLEYDHAMTAIHSLARGYTGTGCRTSIYDNVEKRIKYTLDIKTK